MTALDSLREAKEQKKATQIPKADISIRGASQYLEENRVSHIRLCTDQQDSGTPDAVTSYTTPARSSWRRRLLDWNRYRLVGCLTALPRPTLGNLAIS